MKNYYKKLIALISCMVTLLSLTACGAATTDGTGENEKNTKTAVAYVITNTANSKQVDIHNPIVQDTMLECASNFGYVFGIRVDGQPELVFADDMDIDERFKKASKERLKLDAQNKSTEELEKIKKITAVEPEVDFLEGLRLASSSLHGLDDTYTSKVIVCNGSGLQTTGILDFTNNIICAKPETIVDSLKMQEALPDLTGLTVYWTGIAEVESPQSKLSPKQSKNLQAIWKAVIEVSGGEFKSNTYAGVEETDEDNVSNELPSVSVVNIETEPPVCLDSEEIEESFETPVMLDEQQIGFKGDSAEYSNPDKASDTIRPIAESLSNNPTLNVLLVGTTAGDQNGSNSIDLSQKRADAVKETLVQFGVDSSRITTKGLGSDNPWHIKNVGYEGSMAEQNRSVVILDAASEQAQLIINGN